MPIEINVEGFKMLCQAHKKDLLLWLTEQMKEYYGDKNVCAPGEYLFCVGNIPMMLCAHVDTVFHEQPQTFAYNDDKKTISSPQGIGGDDRCGVYAVLRILKELGDGKRPYLFFSTDEEVGGASTKKAAVEVKSRIANVNFLVELDRQGKEDSVYYKCGNKDFKKWIDSFGFKEAQGSFTDICTLCKAWDVAGVNLSVGYTNNHHVTEVVNLDHLAATIEKAVNIVKATKSDVLYTFCEKETTYQSYGGGSSYGGDYGARHSKNTFVVNDVAKAKYDCVGFIFVSKKERDRVSTYVEVPANVEMMVTAVSGEEVCVRFMSDSVCKEMTGKDFFVHYSDLKYVRHDAINTPASVK